MTRAIVVGGGVAGPVAAMALQRVGIEVTVHEAHAGPAGDVGAWLGLQTNGLDALRAIGAEQAVAGVGFPTPVVEFRSWTGKVLGAVPTSGPDGSVASPCGAPTSTGRCTPRPCAAACGCATAPAWSTRAAPAPG